MPEIAEIHRYKNNINEWCQDRVFNQVKIFKKKAIDIATPHRFYITATVRGKELKLTLTYGKSKFLYTFRHGLVGQWVWDENNQAKFAKVKFIAENGGSLCFVDKNNIGSWNSGGFDLKKRGPDPILEYRVFRNNIYNNLSKNAFNKDICEVMLDQEFFNGIGNYLRSEILFRAKVNPFIRASELFKNNPNEADYLLSLCHTIPTEVLNLGLNKYGTPQEKETFDNWLQVYGKGLFKLDRGKRKIYYDTSQLKSISQQANANNVIFGSSSPHMDNNNNESNLNSKRYYNPISDRTIDVKQMLIAIAMLYNEELITREQRSWLKKEAMLNNKLIFYSLETFEADVDKDLHEFADTLNIIYQKRFELESELN